MSDVKIVNGKPHGHCERCGKWSDFLWTMGNGNDKPHFVCDSCHEYWTKYHLAKINKMKLTNPEKYKCLDSELGIFLKSKNREVVQFT